jgi:acetoin utilization deacetylase AcuC-like enzyme
MIIFVPPKKVDGAVNLSKGSSVFSVTANLAVDTIIDTSLTDLSPVIKALERVHNPEYVKAVLSGHTFNGYGTADKNQNLHSLQSCLIMVEAAMAAIESPSTPVFAPVSGFHHASYNSGLGYCTFNGLVLAAMAVRAHNNAANVLVIDGDGHWGDGTASVIAHHGLEDWLDVCELDCGTVGYSVPVARGKLNRALGSKVWDLVIYQAGADAHKDDPYGAGYLTDDDWHDRDEIIFNHCYKNKVPVLFNLAGGYNGPKTIKLHTSTVIAARRAYREEARAHLSPLPSHG